MSVKIRFTSAAATRLFLARIGHPGREEPLQTSRQIYQVEEDDRPVLTGLFLKPFRNLAGYRFQHHSSLEQHELNRCAKAILENPEELLERGLEIAKRLYTKSNHPNIKSGDLCIALMEDLEVNGEPCRGICILKSESVVPFLSITTRDGDLKLSTEQGINPEKIDKGCLILNHFPHKGFYVLTFDRSGGDSRFWMRDFLGVVPVTDPSFLTKNVADMAVDFLKKEEKAKRGTAEPEAAEETAEAAVADDSPPWEVNQVAKQALSFFEEKEHFSMQEFEEKVLKDPEAVERFKEHRRQIEEEQGQKFDDQFEISRKDLKKVKKRIGTVMKLDTGVEIHVKPESMEQKEPVLEHGFDDEKGMKYVKVYFRRDLSR